MSEEPELKTIVGRKREIELLDNMYISQKAELLAIYGRRRIGKTFLISRYFQKKNPFFEITGIKNGSIRQQIKVFINSLKSTFPNVQVKEAPKDWFDTFDLLKEAVQSCRSKNRIVLFFDEFPWMDTHKSDLLKAFEFIWNSFLSKDPRIITILCGSSVTWMIKKIIRNKGGLHGRLTEQIRLRPFTLLETEDFFSSKNIHLDRKQIIEVYMAIGGIPKYLEYAKPGKSSAQIIQNLCFDPGGPLTTEFEVLCESLFDNYQMHIKVIELLANSREGLTFSKIAAELKGSGGGGNISKTLKELISSDFVQFIPYFGKKLRDGKYRLSDEYSFFYLKWIKKALFNYDEPLSSNYWLKQQSSNKYKSWSGYIYETVCFKHIRQMIKFLQIDVVAEKVAYWSYSSKKIKNGKGAQIDLIIDRSDQCIHLCEIKFYNTEFVCTDEIAKKLNARREIFREQTKTRKSLFNTMISSYGANVNKHYLSSIDQQLTMNALFELV